MPAWYASKGIICTFNFITGVMLVNPEVHQAYSCRSDLRFKQGLVQVTHMHRLMESWKGYSIAAAWGCWKQWGCDKHKAWKSQADWKHLKPVLPSPESLANPCPKPITILFKQQTVTLESPRLAILTVTCSSAISQGNHCFGFCLQPLKLQSWILSSSSPS